jgi:cobalt/nickel transport system permease protein
VKYEFLDRYTDIGSIVHGMDARLKIICALIFVLTLVSIPIKMVGYMHYALYFLVILAVIMASRLPLSYVLKRSLVVAPFILIPAAAIPFVPDGLAVFVSVFFKSWLSALTMVTLVSTTPSADLLAGLRALGVPALIVTTISFMHRYLSVIEGELLGMKTARDARSSRGNRRWYIKTAGNIIGSLFIRSYGRAERIYAAMLSRGYEGTMRAMNKFRMTPKDAMLATLFLTAVIVVRVS